MPKPSKKNVQPPQNPWPRPATLELYQRMVQQLSQPEKWKKCFPHGHSTAELRQSYPITDFRGIFTMEELKLQQRLDRVMAAYPMLSAQTSEFVGSLLNSRFFHNAELRMRNRSGNKWILDQLYARTALSTRELSALQDYLADPGAFEDFEAALDLAEYCCGLTDRLTPGARILSEDEAVGELLGVDLKSLRGTTEPYLARQKQLTVHTPDLDSLWGDEEEPQLPEEQRKPMLIACAEELGRRTLAPLLTRDPLEYPLERRLYIKGVSAKEALDLMEQKWTRENGPFHREQQLFRLLGGALQMNEPVYLIPKLDRDLYGNRPIPLVPAGKRPQVPYVMTLLEDFIALFLRLFGVLYDPARQAQETRIPTEAGELLNDGLENFRLEAVANLVEGSLAQAKKDTASLGKETCPTHLGGSLSWNLKKNSPEYAALSKGEQEMLEKAAEENDTFLEQGELTAWPVIWRSIWQEYPENRCLPCLLEEGGMDRLCLGLLLAEQSSPVRVLTPRELPEEKRETAKAVSGVLLEGDPAELQKLLLRGLKASEEHLTRRLKKLYGPQKPCTPAELAAELGTLVKLSDIVGSLSRQLQAGRERATEEERTKFPTREESDAALRAAEQLNRFVGILRKGMEARALVNRCALQTLSSGRRETLPTAEQLRKAQPLRDLLSQEVLENGLRAAFRSPPGAEENTLDRVHEEVALPLSHVLHSKKLQQLEERLKLPSDRPVFPAQLRVYRPLALALQNGTGPHYVPDPGTGDRSFTFSGATELSAGIDQVLQESPHEILRREKQERRDRYHEMSADLHGEQAWQEGMQARREDPARRGLLRNVEYDPQTLSKLPDERTDPEAQNDPKQWYRPRPKPEPQARPRLPEVLPLREDDEISADPRQETHPEPPKDPEDARTF